MVDKVRCRFNQYYNQFNYIQTGFRMWKPSVWHIWVGDNSVCRCGDETW